MSRPLPRYVYLRRRLLVLAAAVLLVWVAVQLWPKVTGGAPDPTVTATVASPVPAQPTTPVPTTPPTEWTTTVALRGGGKACAREDVMITPAGLPNQHARSPVGIDIAVTTTGKKPCTVTPKSYDPLIVISQDDEAVFDSSACKDSLVTQRLQLLPGWSTTIRLQWIPRASGKDCDDDEDWAEPGKYTVQIGTLGGEPGKTNFTLLPPKPKPSPTPTPTATAKPTSLPTDLPPSAVPGD